MALFSELGKFLEKGTEILGEVSATLREARETLHALRPTLAALPSLIVETRGLVSETRKFVAEVTPLLTEGARRTVDLLDAARDRMLEVPDDGSLDDIN